jgi:hypothetical protein
MATMDYYIYTDDNGIDHTIRLKKVNGDAVGNTGGAAPNLPVSHKKLRHVDLELISGLGIFRKRIPVCDPGLPIWGPTPPATVSIDGVAWDVKGRIGERRF